MRAMLVAVVLGALVLGAEAWVAWTAVDTVRAGLDRMAARR